MGAAGYESCYQVPRSCDQKPNGIFTLTRLGVLIDSIWNRDPRIHEWSKMQVASRTHEMNTARRREWEIAILARGIVRCYKSRKEDREMQKRQKHHREDDFARLPHRLFRPHARVCNEKQQICQQIPE